MARAICGFVVHFTHTLSILHLLKDAHLSGGRPINNDLFSALLMLMLMLMLMQPFVGFKGEASRII
jgi:hypothetical protein